MIRSIKGKLTQDFDFQSKCRKKWFKMFCFHLHLLVYICLNALVHWSIVFFNHVRPQPGGVVWFFIRHDKWRIKCLQIVILLNAMSYGLQLFLSVLWWKYKNYQEWYHFNWCEIGDRLVTSLEPIFSIIISCLFSLFWIT